MFHALDTAWRIIKTFLWILHYSNKGSDVCCKNKATANEISCSYACDVLTFAQENNEEGGHEESRELLEQFRQVY